MKSVSREVEFIDFGRRSRISQTRYAVTTFNLTAGNLAVASQFNLFTSLTKLNLKLTNNILSEYLMQLNASRIKVLQALDDVINSMKEAVSNELLNVHHHYHHLHHHHYVYRNLLKDLIVLNVVNIFLEVLHIGTQCCWSVMYLNGDNQTALGILILALDPEATHAE
ncbi:hypothetical protein RJT34_02845 [Clitoria ternatea]|uniref:Uncharacterized protein n=1 Tax=Clitoria ternatea TaxID=43366 RepID=A0AAN9KIN5_CLITE